MSPSWRGNPSATGSRPSSGNDSTSVASSMPRCSRLRSRISSGLTNWTPTSPPVPPPAASAPRTPSPASSAGTSPPLLFSTSTATTGLPAPPGPGLLRVLFVGLHDALHQLVPDHILVVEADEGDAVDVAEDVLHLDQPGGLLARQVDLRHVAGDDDLGAEAEPREEHLHLLGARVLRLVEDDERVVQRAAAHEGERRHLDGAALHERRQLVRVEHVVERVEQRAQVRIDLREHVARQEAEPLAGLDRRPREDDPPH